MLTIYFGRRGSGKTTSIRAAIPTFKKPVVIIDILGNYQGYESHGRPWSDTTSTTDALQALQNYLRDPTRGTGIITVQTGDIDFAADFLCSALWRIGGGTLIMDEGDAFDRSEAPCFDEAIRYGRNRGIDMVFGCRRPAEISKNVTAGADVVYVFNTTEPNDIEYYRDYLGDPLALKLSTLPPHTGVFKDFLEQTEGEFIADAGGTVHRKKPLKPQIHHPLAVPKLEVDPEPDPADSMPPAPTL